MTMTVRTMAVSAQARRLVSGTPDITAITITAAWAMPVCANLSRNHPITIVLLPSLTLNRFGPKWQH